MQTAIGATGLIGVLLRRSRPLHALLVGYNVFLVSSFVSFILKWLEWFMALGGQTLTNEGNPWILSNRDRLFMIFFTLEHLLIYIISLLLVTGVLRSTRMVIIAGGTGWELKNYSEVAYEKMIEAFIEEEELDP